MALVSKSKKIDVHYQEKSKKENIDIDVESVSDSNSECVEEKPSFGQYITTKKPYSYNAYFISFAWNGIDLIDRWELQRKIDYTHASELANSMKRDYKLYKSFVSYDPIHIGYRTDLTENKYYILDGQHRLEAYKYFYSTNKYPIQQIPAILWMASSEHQFVELFNKINSRLSIDKLKLVQVKLLEIFSALEKKYTGGIFGTNRPKINKEIFADKLKNTEFIHKLTSEEIINNLITINNNIRKLPRGSRIKPNCSSDTHARAEYLDWFLGLDKNMNWMEEIK